jgi:aspartate racemase
VKTIGMIGGMSWESTLQYYRIVNETVRDRLGGLHSAKCLLYSVEFSQIETLMQTGQWEKITKILIAIGNSLAAAGADFLMICTNTVHKIADDFQAGVSIPLLHIADSTAEKIRPSRIKKVGLLGTRFTMEEDFLKKRIEQKAHVEVIIPVTGDREEVHRVIFEELCLGKIKPDSKQRFLQVINRLKMSGAEAVILGCTEIELLVKNNDTQMPLFDTTRIHAENAVARALNGA